MELYINATGTISPQRTFRQEAFPAEIVTNEQTGHMRCIEPVYKEFIDPMVARRMSRVIKMSYCAAKVCLQQAGVQVPDAIVAGTGMGCIEDTEKFLTSIITNNEQLLNPTPFIQSTHNTVAAQIALMVKCHNYNFTYVHRGNSFESALLDSMMLLQEGKANNVLVGSVDEQTENSLVLLKRLGHLKAKAVNNLHLLQDKTRGTIAGEGSSFFLLSKQKQDKSLAKLNALTTFHNPVSAAEIEEHIKSFITSNGLTANDIDLVITGQNGDPAYDNIYTQVLETILQGIPSAYFKHLCGEYHTSSAFALWMATQILSTQTVPEIILINKIPVKKVKLVLIYNHYRNQNHSLYLLSSC